MMSQEIGYVVHSWTEDDEAKAWQNIPDHESIVVKTYDDFLHLHDALKFALPTRKLPCLPARPTSCPTSIEATCQSFQTTWWRFSIQTRIDGVFCRWRSHRLAPAPRISKGSKVPLL